MASDIASITSKKEARKLACERFFQIGEFEKLDLTQCIAARPAPTQEGKAQRFSFFFPDPVGEVVSQPYRKGDLGELAYVALMALRFDGRPNALPLTAPRPGSQIVFYASAAALPHGASFVGSTATPYEGAVPNFYSDGRMTMSVGDYGHGAEGSFHSQEIDFMPSPDESFFLSFAFESFKGSAPNYTTTIADFPGGSIARSLSRVALNFGGEVYRLDDPDWHLQRDDYALYAFSLFFPGSGAPGSVRRYYCPAPRFSGEADYISEQEAPPVDLSDWEQPSGSFQWGSADEVIDGYPLISLRVSHGLDRAEARKLSDLVIGKHKSSSPDRSTDGII